MTLRLPQVLPLLLLAAACTADAGPAGEEEVEREPAAFRGDALIVRLVAEVAHEERVPRDLLLGLGWAETRLVPRDQALPPGAHDAEEVGDPDADHRPHEGEGATCGLFGLDEGSARGEAAALVDAPEAMLCASAELESRAAARRLRVLAGGDGAPPLTDLRAWLGALDAWHPALAEDGFPYGEYLAEVLGLGFEGTDEVGERIWMPPLDLEGEPTSEVGAARGYARPDTPLAEWRGPACDYTPMSRRIGDVRYIIIHTCEGGFAGCLSTLKSCGGSSVSAHYVTSYTGYAAQVVEEKDKAWHVGCLNGSSIGIENEGYAGSTHHPDAQMCKTARIVRSICDRWRIPCDRAHVIGHVEANRLYCHGSHWDPGPHWDWAKFMRFVSSGCGCTPSPEVCDGRDNDCDGRVDEGVTNRCGTCGPEPVEVCNGRDDDCDGQVDEGVCDRAAPRADALPGAIDLGATLRHRVTFRNAGTTTWGPGRGYAIEVSASGAAVERSGGIEGSVAPGADASVDLTITPRDEGEVAVTVRVTRDGSGIAEAWRGTMNAQRPPFAASFADVSGPMAMDALAEREGYAVVRNEGRDPWPAETEVGVRAGEETALSVRGFVTGVVPAGETARVPLTFRAMEVPVETEAEAVLVVRLPDGTEATWPEQGRSVSVALRPLRTGRDATVRPEAGADDVTVAGGCSAAGAGPDAGPAPMALGLLVLVAGALRRRGRAALLAAAGLLAVLGSGCTGRVCAGGSDVCEAAALHHLEPSVGTARGGERVTLHGAGLSAVTELRLGGQRAVLEEIGDGRITFRTPAGVAGVVELAARVDGVDVLLAGAYTYQPLTPRFVEAPDRFPADDVEAREVAVADFDGDGDLDLVVAVRGGVPRYLLNDGRGVFAPAPEGFIDAPAIDAVGIAFADVDLDGDVDVLVPGYGQQQDVLLRNRAGVLEADPGALPADASSDHTAVFGDVNGDGYPDLLLCASGDDPDGAMRERLLINDGTGVFTELEGAIPERRDRTTGAAFGDLDGDGHLDLITANDGAEDVHLRMLLNRGDGTFRDAEPGALPSPPDRARRPLLGDLDGDGHLDIVAVGYGQDHLFLNDGRGRFYDATFLTLPTDDRTSFGAALADLDLDGDLDLVVGNVGAQERVYLNAGDGRMDDASLLFPSDSTPTRAVAVADFDGDGAPDVLVIEGPGTAHRLLVAAPTDELAFPYTRTADGSGMQAGCSAAGPAPAGATPWLALLLAPLSLAWLRRAGRSVGPAAAAALALLIGCADDDPVVESMTPAAVSARGGEPVTLHGSGLEGVKVYVDDAPVEVLHSADTVAVFRAPRHLAGLASVEVVRGNRLAQAGDLAYDPLPVRFRIEDVGEAVAARRVRLADIDGDGDLDALVALRDRVLGVYENREGVLFDVTAARTPEGLEGHGLDIATGDLNGDGRVDAWVVTGGGEPDRVFLQGADGVFAERPSAVPEDLAVTTGVAFGDLDGDGDLDVVTARWRHPAEPAEGARLGPRILENDGTGRFTERAPLALADAGEDPTFSVALADFDGDGHLDLFAANDGAPSRLAFGTGTARGLRAAPEGSLPQATWICRHPAVVDVDLDGDLDLVLATVGQDVLLRNDGSGRFGDATRFSMAARRGHTESYVAADIDLDGHPDLLGAGYDEPGNILDLGDRGEWFVDYGARLRRLPAAQEVAFDVGDIDGDGDPDLVLGATGAPLRVLYQRDDPFLRPGAVVTPMAWVLEGGGAGTPVAETP